MVQSGSFFSPSTHEHDQGRMLHTRARYGDSGAHTRQPPAPSPAPAPRRRHRPRRRPRPTPDNSGDGRALPAVHEHHPPRTGAVLRDFAWKRWYITHPHVLFHAQIGHMWRMSINLLYAACTGVGLTEELGTPACYLDGRCGDDIQGAWMTWHMCMANTPCHAIPCCTTDDARHHVHDDCARPHPLDNCPSSTHRI